MEEWGSVTQPKSGVIKDTYVGDSIINGISCKHILGTFKGKLSPNSPTTTVNNYRQSYSYENNKVLYVWSYDSFNNLNTFDTVVNFNAAIGDKWLKNRWAGTCNSRNAMVVTDTGHITINNVSLKKIVTTYTSSYVFGNTTYTVVGIDTLIEKLGSRSKFMIPQYCEQDNTTDGGVYNGNFLCYEDNGFPSYQKPGTSTCDYVVGLHEWRGFTNNISIYPNPASGVLNLESEHFKDGEWYRLTLMDLVGQEIVDTPQAIREGKLQLDVSPFRKGVYFVSVSGKDNFRTGKKIIIK